MTLFSENNLLDAIKKILLEQMPIPGEKPTCVESLVLVRRDNPNYCHSGFSTPMAALVCQGEKRIIQGNQEIHIHPGELLITSIDLPTTSRIGKITSSNPFLLVYFFLEKKIFAELLSEMPNQPAFYKESDKNDAAFKVSIDFLATMHRLLTIAQKPESASILGPLLIKELHYLLLTNPQSSYLYQFYLRGTPDNQIVEAITLLKNNLDKNISMEELAKKVFMSVSSLHRHFKKVTGFSPLQYHKELRLFEAQRLMLAENERADMAAMAVGYESITQFNREYKRKFGLPPHQDIMARRNRFNERLDDI